MSISVNRGVYNVVRGDCLWKIARREGVSLSSLIAANPQIKNPDLIKPGQSVTIPGRAAAASPAPRRTGLSGLWDRTNDFFSSATSAVSHIAGKLKDRVGSLLNLASAQVGTLESGNNAGAITKFTGGQTGWPWCAKFVSWVYRQSGMPLPGGDQWSVAGIKSIIHRLGQWTDKHRLQPGMAVTFARKSHVEIIAKPVYTNGALAGYMTMGGNTSIPGSSSQGVAYKFRSLAEIEGGGYPVQV